MEKVALITGASSGIGFELAKIPAARGGSLVLVARREDRLLELKRQLEKQHNTNVILMTHDLTNPEAALDIYQTLQKKGIFVECLINNAGFGVYGPFHQASWESQQKMLQLNITALTHLTHLFLPDMIAHKKGHVLQVASTAAFQPGPLLAVYYATKHYVLAFSEAIACELAGTGVTVTALCPGPTESEFQQVAQMQKSKLVSGKKLPSSQEVARYGYEAMLRGDTVAIHGVLNRFIARGVRFLPRNLVTRLVKRIQTPEK